MIDTGKKARRVWGTRAAAKRAKGRGKARKHFVPVAVKVCDLPHGEAAYALAKKLGFQAPVDISKRYHSFQDRLALDN
jgi:hypothetical protein